MKENKLKEKLEKLQKRKKEIEKEIFDCESEIHKVEADKKKGDCCNCFCKFRCCCNCCCCISKEYVSLATTREQLECMKRVVGNSEKIIKAYRSGNNVCIEIDFCCCNGNKRFYLYTFYENGGFESE